MLSPNTPAPGRDRFAVYDHKLEGVPFRLAHAFRDQDMTPTGIVLHDTAGRLTKRNSVEWFLSPQCTTSAHIVVERDGSVTQLVPFNRIAFHAGQSSWNGQANCNNRFIGIEIVNPGKLTKAGNGAKAYFGQTWPLDQVQPRTTKEHGAGYWMPYTPEQIDTVKDLCRTLAHVYPIEDIVTHWMISPGRKVDTNPLFPLDEVRAHALNPIQDEPVNDNEAPSAPGVVAGMRANFAALNDLADQGSRVAQVIRTIKRWFWRSAGAAGGGALLIDPDKGTGNVIKQFVVAHPLISVVVVGLVVGGVLYVGIKLVEKYLLTAHKAGRYYARAGGE